MMIKSSLRKLLWLDVLLGTMLAGAIAALPSIWAWLAIIFLAPLFVILWANTGNIESAEARCGNAATALNDFSGPAIR